MYKIKFRAWNAEINGFEYLEIINCHSILTTLPIPSEGKWKNLKEFQQYTGLKDKNGKEIYEGDVVKCRLSYGDTFTVKWIEKRASFMLVGINEHNFAAYDKEGYKMNAGEKEVIGNVYENKKLLKDLVND